MTDPKASQEFYDRITNSKKKITLIPVSRFLYFWCTANDLQGGYHELHNEPDGMREQLIDEILTFIEEHAKSSSTSSVSHQTPITTEAKTEATVVETTKAKM